MSVPHHAPKPPARRLPPPLRDWDFWRFVVAALSLLWDIVKTATH